MDQQTISELVDADMAATWENKSPQDLTMGFNMVCVGGSTQKPTSQAKKQEAVQLAQTLGQFANAAPGVVLKTVMKVFQSAFDEVVFTEDDWEQLTQEIASGQQQGVSTQPGGPQQAGQPQPSPQAGAGPTPQPQATPPAQGAQGGGNPVFQMLDKMSPQAKKALATAFTQGVPIEQALQHIQQMSNQGATH
jgi:hypothetical protein